MDTIQQRYQNIINALHQQAPSTRLLAVSKGQPVSKVRALYQAGQRAFGESYLREAQQKISECRDLTDIQWHYIGPLQRNKTRPIAELFDWVHSVDRPILIERLGSQRPAGLQPLNVLLQINVDNEQQKSGTGAEQIPSLAQTIGTFATLKLRGIMGIPKQQQTNTGQRDSFAALYAAYQQCLEVAPSTDTLSMGMSGDWQLAVQEGASMVRIGTALFGPRNQR